ncbi:hypothetical protein Ac2012v2_005604 [Leucoagaricus gongylophorus]
MATSLPSFSQAFSSMSAPRKRTRDDSSVPHTKHDDHDPPKKRRVVTVVGVPQDPVPDTQQPPEHPAPSPASPPVSDHMRSLLVAKHKQKQKARPSTSSRPLPFPPPNSFAQRRTGFKPADIVISPREDDVEPAIQSAPPVPQGMAIPRLPPVMRQADNPRKVASKVPPTPARLSRLRQGLRASPPAPSVAIASTLVPTTPAVLHHPGYSGDKSAFLAPFELFYDALNDAKQLKVWLSQQLQHSHALIQSCSHHQDKLNDTIDTAVDKKVSTMTAELVALRRRVDELEDILRTRRPSTDASLGLPKHKQPSPWNGATTTIEPYAYSSPPLRRRPSPTWVPDRDPRRNPGDSERHASPSYDSRRVSATRLDPPPIRDSTAGAELARSLSHTDPAGPPTPSSTSPHQQPSLHSQQHPSSLSPSSSSSSPSSSSSKRPGSRRNSADGV